MKGQRSSGKICHVLIMLSCGSVKLLCGVHRMERVKWKLHSPQAFDVWRFVESVLNNCNKRISGSVGAR